jgi:flagellar biosynthetic protein FliR
MVLNLHHYLIATIVDSYITVPATGAMPDLAAFAEIVARTVTLAFKIGVLMAMPFIVIGLIVQAGAGVLGRLMPQLQIFFLLLPGQILIGLMILTIVLSTSILYWANSYEATVAQALAP